MSMRRVGIPHSASIYLQRLAFFCVLNANCFRWFGHACILEVMYDAGQFLVSLTCPKGLRRFTFDLQHDRAFQDNDEPRRRMVVIARCCTRREVSRPYGHFLAFHPGKVRLEKVGTFDGWLL